MSTWEERMADRAAARKAAAKAERKRLEAEEQARLAVEFPAIEGEHERAETSGEHYGHRVHQCTWHLWGMVCSCGTLLYPEHVTGHHG